jgi:hypothetical protein
MRSARRSALSSVQWISQANHHAEPVTEVVTVTEQRPDLIGRGVDGVFKGEVGGLCGGMCHGVVLLLVCGQFNYALKRVTG